MQRLFKLEEGVEAQTFMYSVAILQRPATPFYAQYKFAKQAGGSLLLVTPDF